MTTAIRVGADIGGTFTDVTLIDTGSRMHLSKVLTTHRNPAHGVIEGLQQVGRDAGVDLRRISSIIHGTTLVINALIERRGVKTALMCTEGFRHVLDIANENRYDLYDLLIERPEPLVPPALRCPVRERIYSDGSVVTPLDPESIQALIPELRRQEVRAVAVSLLHSYKNPTHEQRIADILRREAPDLYVTLSPDLVPEIREYPRTSTTVANVYVRPVIEQYLRSTDGLSAAIFPSGIRGTPVEIVETASPLVITRKELRCDSGGAGASRGGLGQEVHVRVRSDAPLEFTAMFDRTRFPARGLHGGQAGACGEVLLDDGTVLASKGKHVIPAEHTLILRLPGGGGYGSALARAPETVAQDVRNGFVSHQQAAAVYGVIIDRQTGVLDAEATARRRARMATAE